MFSVCAERRSSEVKVPGLNQSCSGVAVQPGSRSSRSSWLPTSGAASNRSTTVSSGARFCSQTSWPRSPTSTSGSPAGPGTVAGPGRSTTSSSVSPPSARRLVTLLSSGCSAATMLGTGTGASPPPPPSSNVALPDTGTNSTVTRARARTTSGPGPVIRPDTVTPHSDSPNTSIDQPEAKSTSNANGRNWIGPSNVKWPCALSGPSWGPPPPSRRPAACWR